MKFDDIKLKKVRQNYFYKLDVYDWGPLFIEANGRGYNCIILYNRFDKDTYLVYVYDYYRDYENHPYVFECKIKKEDYKGFDDQQLLRKVLARKLESMDYEFE